MSDNVNAEESVDAVLGMQPSQDHAEVPRIDGETPQNSPATCIIPVHWKKEKKEKKTYF